MTQIAADPRAFTNFSLKIGNDTFEKHASGVNWSKDEQIVTWHGGTPDASFSESIVKSHTCNIKLVHDYENADSLFNFLLDHEGEEAVVIYKPDANGTFTQTATIKLVAPTVGGDYAAYGESTIQCPSTKPVRTFVGTTPPDVTSLTPSTVAIAGDDLVAIAGTGFEGISEVSVDGDPATFYVISNTLIHLETPAHAAGAVNVVVTGIGGSSTADSLTYA